MCAARMFIAAAELHQASFWIGVTTVLAAIFFEEVDLALPALLTRTALFITKIPISPFSKNTVDGWVRTFVRLRRYSIAG